MPLDVEDIGYLDIGAGGGDAKQPAGGHAHSRKCLVVAGVVILLVAACLGLGVVALLGWLGVPTVPQIPGVPSGASEARSATTARVGVPLVPGTVQLPPSVPGEILRLERGSSAGGCRNTSIRGLGAARSYDGRAWQPIVPSPLPVTCDAQQRCTVQIPGGDDIFCLTQESSSARNVPTSPSAAAARLLAQTSFGATAASIAHVAVTLGGSASAYVAEQLALPPTLLREHLRARTHPKSLANDNHGTLRSACEAGSRWHKHALQFLDAAKGLEITLGGVTQGFYAFRLDGLLVTEVAAGDWTHGTGRWTVCEVDEYLGLRGDPVRLTATPGCCSSACRIQVRNPAIHFATPNAAALDFSGLPMRPHHGRSDVVFLGAPATVCPRKLVDTSTFMCVDAACTDYYRHDPRVKVVTNTRASPARSGNGGDCPAPARTFLNEHTCVLTTTCSHPTFGGAQVTLDDATLRAWFTESNVYAYKVIGLRLEDSYNISPCSSGRSRWRRSINTVCAAPTTTLNTTTLATLQAALSGSSDTNLHLRDISLTGAGCTDVAREAVGAQVQAGPDCFQHVHPHEMDVRDFSDWVLQHDGNDEAFDANRPNPIAQFAISGSTSLSFPANHGMWRWDARVSKIPLAGRFGDVVDFTSLNVELQTLEMAQRTGAVANTGAAVQASCGSPGEIANNQPQLGSYYPAIHPLPENFRQDQLDYPYPDQDGKSVLWNSVAFSAPDQLRQRWAWGLAHILTIADSIPNEGDKVEPWAVFYDIFVRHAFGNYRDILREVAYNPLMGRYLTFRQNKAYADTRNFPDENFAREIMQLYSIGLYRLRMDGTTVHNSRGEPQETYTNDDIVAFARIWTGFQDQKGRPNVESLAGFSSTVDPMQIVPDWRDRLPKTALDSGYIGDGYPLCEALPPQDFLRQGAVFELSGSSSVEGVGLDAETALPDEVFPAANAAVVSGPSYDNRGYLHFRNNNGDYIEWRIRRTAAETVELRAYHSIYRPEGTHLELQVNGLVVEPRWFFPHTRSPERLGAPAPVTIHLTAGENTIRLSTIGEKGPNVHLLAFGGDGAVRARLQPNPATSQLFQALCAPRASGRCTFPSLVTLPSNLACDGRRECNAGRVLTVAVVDPITAVRQYYRYRPRPCVRLALYGGGRVVKQGGDAQCASARASHLLLCCRTGTTSAMPADLLGNDVLFANEAVTFATATVRCAARGGVVCPSYTHQGYTHQAAAEGSYVWTRARCRVKIQVYPDLHIGLVDPRASSSADWEWKASSGNKFKVRWDNRGTVPTPATNCGGCAVQAWTDGATCLCDVDVRETVPFPSSSRPPTAAQVEGALFIGAVPPAVHGAGVYVRCAAACPAGVTVWTLASDGGAWTRDTIFGLSPRRAGGAPRYLMNQAVTVHVDGTGATFRNPPAFMPGLGEQIDQRWFHQSADLFKPEAAAEVEALLDHLVEHDSTAPFVARRLITQMVTSNPSQEYMTAVTGAFASGSYAGHGSGRYGDLAATAAAVVLHPEARTAVLDADPTFGRSFEPLLKVMAMLRGMEWAPSQGQELDLDTEDIFGQQPFRQPSVFGFFLPEFATGAAERAGLVSPELQLAQAPFLIGYLNGMVSLIDRGLSSCSDGFGSRCEWDMRHRGFEGFLRWRPASPPSNPAAVVDELALILTQDRLHPASRSRIAAAYAAKAASAGPGPARKLALKLLMMTPEFSNSGVNAATGRPQPVTSTVPSRGRPYKAIVVLFQDGGCDSFNVLVPHSNCVNGDALVNGVAPRGSHAEYKKVRTDGAILRDSLLPISAAGTSQPCGTYGVNRGLPVYKQLYDAGDGAFVANVGAMVEPVSKAQYEDPASGVRLPPSLFAHNFQQLALATVHAENPAAKGVLGRVVESLQAQAQPFAAQLFSIAGNQRLLEGAVDYNIIHSSRGAEGFAQHNALFPEFDALTANESDSVFADTFTKLVRQSLQRTKALGQLLNNARTTANFGNDHLSQQLEQVAKLMKLRGNLQSERDVFVIRSGDFDTHNTWDLSGHFRDINAGLTTFVEEMKAQGLWDDVVFVTVSDFARTLTSNGQGSDHAWGGNHFLAGGAVDGGKILGQFPDTLESDGPLNIGRGRLIPTLPWEYMWSGIAEWFGVKPADMSTVLPHVGNFAPSQRSDTSGGAPKGLFA